MATIDFKQYIRDLNNMGLFDVVLPFILVFVTFFAVLQKTKVLGHHSLKAKYTSEAEPKKKAALYEQYSGKKFNVVVALVVALLVIIPHIVYQGTPHDGKLSIAVAGTMLPDAVDLLNNALPSISVWIVAILMVLLLLGIFGAKMQVFGYPVTSIIALASFAIVVYVFGAVANFWNIPAFLRKYNIDSPQNLFALLLIFAFAAILYFIVKEPGTGGGSQRQATGTEAGRYESGTWPRSIEDLWRDNP